MPMIVFDALIINHKNKSPNFGDLSYFLSIFVVFNELPQPHKV